MSIFEKLSAVQAELEAPKGQYNEFGKYKYRSCEDILSAVKPLLAKNKLALTISDSVEMIGDRFYVVATATVTDIETGESSSVSAMAREEAQKKGMDASQITGATSSYARKYALNGLFCIDDTKDADANGEAPAPKLHCTGCKREIMPRNDGKRIYEPSELAARSKAKYGTVLCVECARKREEPSA